MKRENRDPAEVILAVLSLVAAGALAVADVETRLGIALIGALALSAATWLATYTAARGFLGVWPARGIAVAVLGLFLAFLTDASAVAIPVMAAIVGVPRSRDRPVRILTLVILVVFESWALGRI